MLALFEPKDGQQRVRLEKPGLAGPQGLLSTEVITLSAVLDQRFVFASLALELVAPYWLFPLSLLLDAGDLLAQSKLSVFMAQTSLGLTVASLVLIVIGLLHRRGLIPTHRRLIVGLSWLAIPGILFLAWWAFYLLLVFSEGCDALAVGKCYLVQAGTYFGYDFFPAIAIPIVTLVWVSRIRTPEISPQAPETSSATLVRPEGSYLTRTD